MSGVVALVNIGHEVTNINILDDGVPILTRDITVGTRRFREDLQRERGLSARRGRRRCSRDTTARRTCDAVIETRGEEIAVGIERAAAFLASVVAIGRRSCAPYTCGGGSRIPGLAEALGDAASVCRWTRRTR